MRKYTRDESSMEAILDLTAALDCHVLKAVYENGLLTVYFAPFDGDDWDGDDEYTGGEDEEEDYDADGCPCYEDSGEDGGRCVYCCPECGECLRQYMGEDFE